MDNIFNVVIIDDVEGMEDVGLEVGDSLKVTAGLGCYLPVERAFSVKVDGKPFTIPKESARIKPNK
jgi:hypothetical protein